MRMVDDDTTADPFQGLQPTDIACRWLPGDADKGRTAEVVRLVVDDDRWEAGFANATYQRTVYRRLAEELDRLDARKVRLVISPAGMITVPLDGEIPEDVGELGRVRRVVSSGLADAEWSKAPFDVLAGVDAVHVGRVPIQSAVCVTGGDPGKQTEPVVKVHPAPREVGWLWGWRVIWGADAVPPGILQPRLLPSQLGTVMPLVCHEAVIFSGRSLAKVTNEHQLTVRAHLDALLTHRSKRPALVAMCVHHVEQGHSKVFLDAAAKIAAKAPIPVVPAMFAPKDQLEQQAERFAVLGDKDGRVATLIVETSKE